MSSPPKFNSSSLKNDGCENDPASFWDGICIHNIYNIIYIYIYNVYIFLRGTVKLQVGKGFDHMLTAHTPQVVSMSDGTDPSIVFFFFENFVSGILP